MIIDGREIDISRIPKYELPLQDYQWGNYTDADGNCFIFESADEEAQLLQCNAKTSTVRLPATISDEDGNVYKMISACGFAGDNAKNIKHIILPEGFEALSGSTFDMCHTLLSLYIPASVKYIGQAFWNCPQFEYNLGGRIFYTGTPEQWNEVIRSAPNRGIMDYTPYDTVVRFIDSIPDTIPELDFHTYLDPDTDQEISTVRYCDMGGEFTVPEYYENENGKKKTITQVGINAFAVNKKIKKVTIPPTVDSLDRDAFYCCENLEEVVIEGSDKKLTVGMGAFFGCKNLKTIYVGRECEWGKHALGETNAQIVPLP